MAEVRRTLVDLDTVVRVAHQAGAGMEGEILLGMHTSPASGSLRRLLRAWRKHQPRVSLTLHELPDQALYMAVVNHQLDAAFLAGHRPWPHGAPARTHRRTERAAETELRLKRLYDAIESGVADLDDPALKERIAGLKTIRDQTRADSERAQAMLESAGQQKITPQMVRTFASAAKERMRLQNGGYRRDHLRALAQRVEVADKEVLIMGSKSELLRTLAAVSGVKPDTSGVRSSVLKWRRGRDRNS